MAGDKAAAKAVLAEAGYQITVDGQVIPLERVDPSQLWNFYHVATLLVAYGASRQKAERALVVLDSPPGSFSGPDLMAFDAVQRCGKVDSLALFERVRVAAESQIAQVADPELQAIFRETLATFEVACGFHEIALRGIEALSQRVVAAFEDLQSRAKGVFVDLRPVLQDLMGRPSDHQIDVAIAQVEAAQETVDEQMEDFRLFVDGLTAAENRIPDPTQPMTSPDNEARVKHVRQQLAVLLRDDEATLEAIVQAMARAAGMIQTAVTAIQQVDQRLAVFGVSAPT